MNVYFSANARNIELSIEEYRLIIDAIREMGCAVVNNWTETATFRGNRSLEKVRWQEICREAKTGIEDASVIVAEVSGQSVFGVGYEVGLALGQNKRVLALVHKDQINNSYICGIIHPSLHVATYDLSTLRQVVKAFLAHKVV